MYTIHNIKSPGINFIILYVWDELVALLGHKQTNKSITFSPKAESIEQACCTIIIK